MAEYSDEQFLEYVVKAIVDNPDEVKVGRQVDEMGVLLTLKVSPKDMGQVVGRQGSTAKAIRSLLKIVGIKNNARVNLKIEEPEGGKRFAKETPEKESERSGHFSDTTVGKVIDEIKKDL
jgi:predicted RNA-binding protein YlqC (UPF0109 family)